MVKKDSQIGVEHCWSVLCKKSTLDSETNDLSIISVVDRLQFKVSPETIQKSTKENSRGFMLPVELEIVSKFKKIDKKKPVAFDYRFRFLNPKAEQLGIFEGGRLAMDEKIQNMRVRARIGSFLVEKENGRGDYAIAVDIKSVTEGEYTEVDRIPVEIEWSENK